MGRHAADRAHQAVRTDGGRHRLPRRGIERTRHSGRRARNCRTRRRCWRTTSGSRSAARARRRSFPTGATRWLCAQASSWRPVSTGSAEEVILPLTAGEADMLIVDSIPHTRRPIDRDRFDWLSVAREASVLVSARRCRGVRHASRASPAEVHRDHARRRRRDRHAVRQLRDRAAVDARSRRELPDDAAGSSARALIAYVGCSDAARCEAAGRMLDRSSGIERAIHCVFFQTYRERHGHVYRDGAAMCRRLDSFEQVTRERVGPC